MRVFPTLGNESLTSIYDVNYTVTFEKWEEKLIDFEEENGTKNNLLVN